MNAITGHVRKRRWRENKDAEWQEGSWEYVLELGKAGERRRRPSRGGFRTKKLAEAALRDELRRREAGTYVETSTLTVGAYLTDRWLPWTQERTNKPLRETTHDLYSRIVRVHIVPDLGETLLQELGPASIDALYVSLSKGDESAGRTPIGSHSLHNVATVLHGAMQQAVKWELIARNPAAGATAPAREPHEAAHWTSDEVAAFLDYVDAATAGGESVEIRERKSGTRYEYRRQLEPDPMERALWYVLANTGMRRGEASGLRWPCVDLEAGLLRIEVARVQAGGRIVTSAPKTARGLRTVKLDPETIDVLRAWRREQTQEHLRYASRWEDAEHHVFTHAVRFTDPPRYGVPIAPNWISARFAKRAAECELPELTVHGLRHTWGTAALESGEHLRAVADHLGHADTAVTDRVYTHTVQRVQDTTALRVAALIASKRGGGGKQRAADGRQD